LTALAGTCDICGYSNIDQVTWRPTGEIVGVASVPGFAVSIAWCIECLKRGAFPMFCVEYVVCDGELTLEETIVQHGIEPVMKNCADWFLDSVTYVMPEATGGNLEVDGRERAQGPAQYVKIRDYLNRIAEYT